MPMSSSALVADVVADRLVDRGELHRAGVAVDQRDAVEEEAGGEGAEQEVLERGLLAEQPAPARQPAEEVERQREHLERRRTSSAGRWPPGRASCRRPRTSAAGRPRCGRGPRSTPRARPRCRAARPPGRRTPRRRPRGGARRRAARRAMAKTRTRPQRKTRRAVDGDACPRRRAMPRAAPSPQTLEVAWRRARRRRGRRPGRPGRARPGRGSALARGTNASTTTPRQATPKTTSSGHSSAYSMVGLTNSITRGLPARRPCRTARSGVVGARPTLLRASCRRSG